MIYKSKKRIELDFDPKLKSYLYKGKVVTHKEADKIKQKWALKDLMENAVKDSEFTPIGLLMFEILINSLTPRELTARNQPITYHGIRRYVECVFKFYDVVKRDVPLSKVKRPHIAPELTEENNPWLHGELVDGGYVYKGLTYVSSEERTKVFKLITMSTQYVYANNDDVVASLANQTGTPLFSELVKVAYKNNDLKSTPEGVYDYLKHLIVTMDRHFDLTLLPNTKIHVGQSRLTDTMYYCLSFD